MKQMTRFKITVTVLTIILVISIALFIKVYKADESVEITQSTTGETNNKYFYDCFTV